MKRLSLPVGGGEHNSSRTVSLSLLTEDPQQKSERSHSIYQPRNGVDHSAIPASRNTHFQCTVKCPRRASYYEKLSGCLIKGVS